MRHEPILSRCVPTLMVWGCPLTTYPVLAVFSDCYPSRQGRLFMCYSPVRHWIPERIPFDLHVLGTPPAFILSQDQTLRLIIIALLLNFFCYPDIFRYLRVLLTQIIDVCFCLFLKELSPSFFRSGSTQCVPIYFTTTPKLRQELF